MTDVFSSGMSFGSFYFLGTFFLGCGDMSSKLNGPPSDKAIAGGLKSLILESAKMTTSDGKAFILG